MKIDGSQSETIIGHEKEYKFTFSSEEKFRRTLEILEKNDVEYTAHMNFFYIVLTEDELKQADCIPEEVDNDIAKVIVTNADKFTEDCDLAGTREFLFGMYKDEAEINGAVCRYHEGGYIETDQPLQVANHLNCTGDWLAYPERPRYEVVR